MNSIKEGELNFQRIDRLQRVYPDSSIPSDVEGMLRMVLQSESVIEELRDVDEYGSLFRYWHYVFDGNIESIFKALNQLNRCAIRIKVYGELTPKLIRDQCEQNARDSLVYLKNYEKLKTFSEELDIPMRILTWQADYPDPVNQSSKRRMVPSVPALDRMLDAVRLHESLLELKSSVASKRSTISTWAIRYLWKNINIHTQDIIEGHPLLGDRWKLIELLLNGLNYFDMDPNTVRLTLSRNLPTPEMISTKNPNISIEDWDRPFRE